MTLTFFVRSRTSIIIVFLIASVTAANSETIGGVILRWTAPGDDNFIGTASGYDIRYQGQANGPLDSEVEWAAATPIPNEPNPSPALTVDSVQVLGLNIGSSYYFALRSFDEVGNYSVFSNSPLIVATALDCCIGKVGNVNGSSDDEPTIADISMLIDNLFISNRPLWCTSEADVNQSGGILPKQGTDGDITISDISALIDHLFITGRVLPDCY
jgi:hypothetical protein